MLHEVGFVLKEFTAFATLRGARLGVGSLVTEECGLVPEGFAAFAALKGPFPRVDPLVLHEVEPPEEGHATLAAGVWPDSGVDFLVLHEDLFPAEAFPTLRAPVIIPTRFKGLSALGAWLWLPPVARSPALEEPRAGWEARPTFAAGEGLLCQGNAAPSGGVVSRLLRTLLEEICPTDA